MFEKTKINEKEASVGPFLKKDLEHNWLLIQSTYRPIVSKFYVGKKSLVDRIQNWSVHRFAFMEKNWHISCCLCHLLTICILWKHFTILTYFTRNNSFYWVYVTATVEVAFEPFKSMKFTTGKRELDLTAKYHALVVRKIRFLIWAIPGIFLLIFVFSIQLTVGTYKTCWWLDSNYKPVELEVRALPTESQPLPQRI